MKKRWIREEAKKQIYEVELLIGETASRISVTASQICLVINGYKMF